MRNIIDVVPDQVTVRSVLSVAGDRAMDIARIADREAVVIDSQPLGNAGAEFLHHHVAALVQAQKDFLAGQRLQIKPDRFLIAPQRVEWRALEPALSTPAHAGRSRLFGAPP